MSALIVIAAFPVFSLLLAAAARAERSLGQQMVREPAGLPAADLPAAEPGKPLPR